MTPQEKSQQLIKKFSPLSEWYENDCALIAVEEVLGIIDDLSMGQPLTQRDFWQQVKEETEKRR